MITNEAEWYKLKDAGQIDSPALLIYPDRVRDNINRLKGMVPNVNLLRPHVKTCKAAEVINIMIQEGITKYKCATIAEAEMLGICGAEDVLLAYQPNPIKLKRFIRLIAKYPQTKYSCLVDNAASATLISELAVQHHITIPVFIDLNVGMNRTGISPQHALTLFNHLQQLPGISFAGLHAYDGHINDLAYADRLANCNRAFAPVEDLRAEIQRQGHSFPLLVAGGSPTFTTHNGRGNTECSPGTFVFWDKNYHDHIPEQGFVFAAIVLTRVVSLPGEGLICIDLGYKAIACEKDLQARACFLNAPELKAYSHSEEHMVLTAGKDHHYQVGDVLYAVPMHVCPTVAMYNEAYVIKDGGVTGQWPITARGRAISV
jgi:D-serine deaminase-like pyridoxal phosphate-dependent protein